MELFSIKIRCTFQLVSTLNRKTAEKIVAEIVEVVKEWRELANRQGIFKREIDMFSGVLDKRYDNI